MSIGRVPLCCSTALCIRCATTALGRSTLKPVSSSGLYVGIAKRAPGICLETKAENTNILTFKVHLRCFVTLCARSCDTDLQYGFGQVAFPFFLLHRSL